MIVADIFYYSPSKLKIKGADFSTDIGPAPLGKFDYPVFGVVGTVNNPYQIRPSSLTYPVFGVAGSTISTPFEPTVSYDLAFTSTRYTLKSSGIGAFLETLPYAEGDITFPVFGLNSIGSQPYFVESSDLVYPTFGIEFEADVPVGVVAEISYPKFGSAITVIVTEYEPVVSYDLAITKANFNLDSQAAFPTISAAGTYLYTNQTYPVFGMSGLVIQPEDLEISINYPTFGIQSVVFSPENLDISYSYPVYGVSIDTQQSVYLAAKYPVFGTDGLIGIEEEFSVESVYPVFGLQIDIGFNRLSGDIRYPTFSSEATVNIVPKEYNGELSYPTFGIGVEADFYNGVRSAISYPTFGTDGSINVPVASFVGLFYPTMGTDIEVKMPELWEGSMTFPTFGVDGLVNVPETIDVSFTFPVFGSEGLVNVPETITIESKYPLFGTNGLVNVPTAVFMDAVYPVFGIEGNLMPTYKIEDFELHYPKFGSAILVGYPDQVDANLRFPLFGLRIAMGGGSDIESTLTYPTFGVSGSLESYYALNVDSIIGELTVESEAWAFKAGRKAIVIRR